VLTLEKYGVKNIVGIQHGFRGFFEDHLAEVPVRDINQVSGKIMIIIPKVV
jgi:hypothetical protein